MLSYEPEVYLALLEDYNAAWWPAHVVALMLAFGALWCAWRGGERSSRAASAVLVLFWAWVAAAFHWSAFATINYAAPVLALLAVIAAIFFLWSGILRPRIAFSMTAKEGAWPGLILVAAGLMVHPLLWLADGATLAQVPAVGMVAGPTALFTLGLLLMTRERVAWHLAALPLVLAVLDGAAGWALGFTHELALIAGAVLFVSTAVWMAMRERARRESG